MYKKLNAYHGHSKSHTRSRKIRLDPQKNAGFSHEDQLAGLLAKCGGKFSQLSIHHSEGYFNTTDVLLDIVYPPGLNFVMSFGSTSPANPKPAWLSVHSCIPKELQEPIAKRRMKHFCWFRKVEWVPNDEKGHTVIRNLYYPSCNLQLNFIFNQNPKKVLKWEGSCFVLFICILYETL